MADVWIESGSARLLVAVEGEGPAVVALHGGNGTHEDVEPLVAPLRDRFQVIAPDIRGWGRSASTDPTDRTPEQYARDTIATLDHLGIERAALCGASLGSVVALATAIRHPERVSALVLMAPALVPGRPRSPQLQDLLDGWVAAADRIDAQGVDAGLAWIDASTLPLTKESLLRHDATGLSASLRAIATLMPAQRLDEIAAITAPTLVVPGLDPVHDPEVGRIYARTIPNATVAEVHIEGPDLVELRAAGNQADLQAYVQEVAAQLGRLTAAFFERHLLVPTR